MCRRPFAIIPSVVAVAFIGCAIERPTQSPSVAKLPSTPISSTILAAASEPVGKMLDVETVNILNFGGSPLSESAAFDDVAISYQVLADVDGEQIDFYDDAAREWRTVVTAFRLPPSAPPSGYSGNFLLSQVERTSPRGFLNPAGVISLRSSFKTTLFARLIDYTDDYHFTTVRTEYSQHASLWHANNSLYAAIGDGLHDSLFAYDLEGNRRWSVPCEPHADAASAFDGSAIWTQAPHERRLIQMDTLGNEILSVASGLGYIQGLTWANGSLWYHADAEIFEIDLQSTRQRDSLVANRRFAIETSPYYVRLTADSSGLVLAGLHLFPDVERVYRYTFDGVLRDTFDTECFLWAIAWDGESMWGLHMGPTDALTNAILLSRFTLE